MVTSLVDWFNVSSRFSSSFVGAGLDIRNNSAVIQLKGTVAANSDVIAALQANFTALATAAAANQQGSLVWRHFTFV